MTFSRKGPTAGGLKGCLLLLLLVSQTSSHSLELHAAENIISKFSGSSPAGTGLNATEFVSFLQAASGKTKDIIRSVLGECPQEVNCTKSPECPGLRDIFDTYGQKGELTSNTLISALPVALSTLTSENCTNGHNDGTSHRVEDSRPSMGEAWAYSVCFASVVVVISNIGACLAPFMDKTFFKRLLQYLVAMGAGSLASTSVLVLIPEAFGIQSNEELRGYVWKSTVMIFSVYAFFCSERILKTFLSQRKRKPSLTMTVDTPDKNGGDDLVLSPLHERKEVNHGHSHGSPGTNDSDRKTLAWMVMAGDVIHNFVDGMSIGAAFTDNIATGISVSLAVVCEELPHELADIAILIHSGLSIKKALLINFLSACFIYLGMVIGVMLGSLIAEASKWIFAMAGGLFLYVPLVDMFPDMSSQLDQLTAVSNKREAKIVAGLQLSGLMVGAGIIIFIVNITGYIVV